MSESKIIMITGGASGIGASVAELAVARGHKVVVADIAIDRACALAEKLGDGVTAVRLDICSEAEWNAALDSVWTMHGRLDTLVNNAAIVHTGWARNVPLSAHRTTIETNFFGGVIGMMTALTRLKSQGSGHLVTISSMNAFIPYPGIASYAAAKHALRAFHAALAIEERNSPVDFTLVYPTATETPMLEKEAQDDAMALAFAGAAVQPVEVAMAIVDAFDTRPVEVFIPADRAEPVKKLGVDPAALLAYVKKNESIGWEKLKARRATAQN